MDLSEEPGYFPCQMGARKEGQEDASAGLVVVVVVDGNCWPPCYCYSVPYYYLNPACLF